MFKIIRIFILLLIFLGIALGTWRERTRSVEWKITLPVNIYLINGDGSQAVTDYIRNLNINNFLPIETFMRDEAVRYDRATSASIEIKLKGILDSQPPEPPVNGNFLQVIIWSLNMRWWAFHNTDSNGYAPQVNMFLQYFDPAQFKRLGHSTGLQKGLIGRVKVFASQEMAKQNNVVIAHEFLHTLGATDKYDRATNQPLYPEGYANLELQPAVPQRFAEIMAGRIPVSQGEAVIPDSLNDVVIGSKTANEINWF
jgi:hypothetical protein